MKVSRHDDLFFCCFPVRSGSNFLLFFFLKMFGAVINLSGIFVLTLVEIVGNPQWKTAILILPGAFFTASYQVPKHQQTFFHQSHELFSCPFTGVLLLVFLFSGDFQDAYWRHYQSLPYLVFRLHAGSVYDRVDVAFSAGPQI